MFDKIIELSVALTLVAAATGNLPKVIKEVQLAQFRLLEESGSSTWGHLMIVKSHYDPMTSHK